MASSDSGSPQDEYQLELVPHGCGGHHRGRAVTLISESQPPPQDLTISHYIFTKPKFCPSQYLMIFDDIFIVFTIFTKLKTNQADQASPSPHKNNATLDDKIFVG